MHVYIWQVHVGHRQYLHVERSRPKPDTHITSQIDWWVKKSFELPAKLQEENFQWSLNFDILLMGNSQNLSSAYYKLSEISKW